ncbi:hypothetical protein I547_3887 [Mycobacterium kansasii 824]|nr:hypothetical protein I547_3887 [Mycobacterium kansasii 824]
MADDVAKGHPQHLSVGQVRLRNRGDGVHGHTGCCLLVVQFDSVVIFRVIDHRQSHSGPRPGRLREHRRQVCLEPRLGFRYDPQPQRPTSVLLTGFGLAMVIEMIDCSALNTSANARTPTLPSFLPPNNRHQLCPNPSQDRFTVQRPP